VLWIVGLLVLWIVGLLVLWIVGLLVLWIVGLLADEDEWNVCNLWCRLGTRRCTRPVTLDS